MRVKRGENRRYGVWMGATLHAGFQNLMRVSGTIRDRAQARARREDAHAGREAEGRERVHSRRGRQRRRELLARLLRPQRPGNVDRRRRRTTRAARGTDRRDDHPLLRLASRRAGEMGPRPDRRGERVQSHYRMNFAWLGDTVWLLRNSESITPEATVPLTRTRNVIVNGRHVTAPVTDAEKRSRERRAGDRRDARPQPPVARRRGDRCRLAATVQDPLVHVPHRPRGRPRDGRRSIATARSSSRLPTTARER